MFEDSLFASRGEKNPARSKWAASVAVMVQGLLVAGLLVAPMLRPLALPRLKTAPEAVSLKLEKPEVRAEPVKVRAAVSNDATMHAPASVPVMESRAGGRINFFPVSSANETAPLVAMGPGMGNGPGNGVGLGVGSGSGVQAAAPTVRVRNAVPPRISSGVSSGLLLTPMRPVYPSIARAAHMEGTVVITATIDKTGRIVGLRVTSGPEMLRSAAVDAVSNARYRPYLLNGEATEVETTIAVNFRMGG